MRALTCRAPCWRAGGSGSGRFSLCRSRSVSRFPPGSLRDPPCPVAGVWRSVCEGGGGRRGGGGGRRGPRDGGRGRRRRRGTPRRHGRREAAGGAERWGVAALPAARSGGGRPRLPAAPAPGFVWAAGVGGGERLTPARPRRAAAAAAAASGPGEPRSPSPRRDRGLASNRLENTASQTWNCGVLASREPPFDIQEHLGDGGFSGLTWE